MKPKNHFFFSVAVAILSLTLTLSVTNRVAAQGVKVIVIDPGHGGKFPGAVYGGYKEKDINLKVSLRLGTLLKETHPDIKVVFTRTKDVELDAELVKDLAARSKIANQANGDLFISIHANAAKKPETVGVETLIMGESSLEIQRNDAALYTANKEEFIDMSNESTATMVLAYIQNLQFTYGEYSEALARLIQKNYGLSNRTLRPVRRQPIMVLYGTDMPCVLTEVGFMTNIEELAYITSEKGTEEIAKSIYGGIKEYIDMVNRISNSTKAAKAKANADAVANVDHNGEKQTVTTQKKESGFTIQILSSNRILSERDSQFKIYAGEQFFIKAETGSFLYKYCVGRYKTREEAFHELPNVRQHFKDAFVITY